MKAPTNYPLTWPAGFPRTVGRQSGQQFKTSLAGALENVQTALRMFGADSKKEIGGLVISSNVTLGVQRPADPGVSVWFTWDGLPVCIAVDRYQLVEANLQAIFHIVEARRTELRHGGLHIVRASFAGFTALPAPNKAAKTWRDVLAGDYPCKTLVEAEARYRTLAKAAHPDRPGGSDEKMAALNAAIDQARKELA